MASSRRAGHVLMALCGLLMVTAQPVASAPSPEPRIIEIRAASFSPYADVPASFVLRGVVSDQQGQPLQGAAVDVGGRPPARTDSGGRFAIDGNVPAGAMVTVSHPDAVTVRREARAFYSGDGGLSAITLTRYTESFAATPAGGVYRGRDMTLEVPAGAVRAPVTIRAAALPPDLAYDDRDGPQFRRVAAVALAPEGLVFAKPVRLRVPNAAGLDHLPPGDVPLAFDEKAGRYRPAPDVSVQRDGNSTIFSLGHFSRYASGNPAEGMDRRLVRITPDINGDGKTTTQDAEFVVILSGGDHGAQWVKSTGSSSAVMRVTGGSESSSSTDTKAGSAGVSFGGVGVEVSGEVSKTEAQEASSAVGSGTTGGASETAEFKLATPEYDTDCKYLLRWYEYWRVRKWSRHTPSDTELPGLEEAYDGRGDQSSEWGYFSFPGRTSMAVGRTLHEGDLVAIRKTAAGYEIYRLKAQYLVRVPKGLATLDCKVGKPNEKAARDGAEAARFFGGGTGMAEAAFDGSTSVRYLGWGVLPDTLPERYTNMECRVETAGEITITSETQDTSEDNASRTKGKSASVKAEVKAEVPFTGGSASGGASASSSRESARTSSESYARSFTTQVSTTIRWEINDPHKPLLFHQSDHELYKLHLLLETRKWRLAGDSEIPKSVRDAAGSGGRVYVGTGGGGMVMRDGDGSFLISGPPAVTQKEIGFMLLRIAERPCPGTPTTTPDDTTSPDDTGTGDESGKGGKKEKVTPSGGRETAPRPPSKPQEPTSPPAEQGSVYTPRGNMDNYTAVPFTALDNRTVIDRRAIGDVQSVTFVAVDGKRMPGREQQAQVTTDDNSVTLDAGDAADVARIVIGGSAGSVELFRPGPTAPGPAIPGPRAGPTIQDGSLEVRNGTLRETVRVPEAVTDPSARLDQHRVAVNNRPVETVAVREGEIAVTGRDVPMPSGGQSSVQVTGPDGATTQGGVPSWGFVVQVQPVTFVGETVPVMFQMQGVAPGERVLVELMPGPAQTITPTRITVTADQLAGGPIPIARLTAQVPGPQALGARATRLDPPAAPSR